MIGAGNRLINDGASTYEYDAEGNRTKKSTGTVITTYMWDQRNRLVEATTKNGATFTMLTTQVYDSFNRRMAANNDGDGPGGRDPKTYRYWWDGDHLQAKISNGTLSDRFLMGPGIDNVIADEKAGTINWTLTDVRGSVQEVIDSTGNWKTRKDYSAFGEKTDTGNPTTVTDTIFGYTGREDEDALGGLQYNRNRWYDPTLKRFVSEDPIGFAGGDANLQRYTLNNPINYVDPDGLKVYLIGRRVPPGGHRFGIHYSIVDVSDDKKSIVTYDGAGSENAGYLADDCGRPIPERSKQETMDQIKTGFFNKTTGTYDISSSPEHFVFEVETPQGWSANDELKALQYSFQYLWQLPYVLGSSPNSNTYANVLLILANMRDNAPVPFSEVAAGATPNRAKTTYDFWGIFWGWYLNDDGVYEYPKEQ